jgi:uncharacterized glyoxalase superfamily protein PhnB
LIQNRSVPAASVIPELGYDDVVEASDWLCNVFGFTQRLRIGNHRVQLVFGEGALIVIERDKTPGDRPDALTHAVLVRVDDADRHHERSVKGGARILQPPTDFPYGERQYNAEDLGGHRWTFSESIADVDPASWGGTLVKAN